MKRQIFYFLLFALLTPLAAIGVANVSNYMEQGGASWIVGGELDVVSGGILDVKSGGALKIAGTDKTSSIAGLPATTNYAVGVASGYMVARGTVTLDGTNPSSATTGLTAIVACSVTDKRSTAPGVDPTAFTIATAAVAGRLDIYAWKPTTTTDTTLVASGDSDDTVDWICVGT
jgi:hypothetical protein